MARVTVEDCIRFYPNRFEMTLLAARRARQILRGMPVLVEGDPHKPVVQALREIGEGQITWERLHEIEAAERRRQEAVTAVTDET